MEEVNTAELKVMCCSEPCKNGLTDQDAVWVSDSVGPKKPNVRWRSTSPMQRGNF